MTYGYIKVSYSTEAAAIAALDAFKLTRYYLTANNRADKVEGTTVYVARTRSDSYNAKVKKFLQSRPEALSF